MSTIDNFLIEITLRKRRFNKIPDEFLSIVTQYTQFESSERLVLDIPRTWPGWKDGTVMAMLRYFGEAMFIALAYISDNDDIVVDFDGRPVDRYGIVIDGIQKTKYVKKRLRIIKMLDTSKEIFQVQDYELNLEYLDAVIKVFDAYCVGSSSAFKLKDFVHEISFNK